MTTPQDHSTDEGHTVSVTAGLEKQVEELQSWRALIVDPKLKDHDGKLEQFEDVMKQIKGVFKFLKIVGGTAGFIAVVCEIVRAAEAFRH